MANNNRYLKVESSTSKGGLSFMGALTIAFIVLKLCHVIDWAWVWVLAPLWGGAAFALAIVALMLLCVALLFVVKAVVRMFRGE